MKALSIKEPYASMIRSGKKTIETRTWKTNHRGTILIVASKIPKTKFSGKGIATAKLITCRPMTKEDEVKACCEIYDRANSWILKDVKPIKPFDVKGKLGLYDVDIILYG